MLQNVLTLTNVPMVFIDVRVLRLRCSMTKNVVIPDKALAQSMVNHFNN